MRTSSSKYFLASCLPIVCQVIIFGQSLEPGLKGTVLDQMGARVARAKIIVKSKAIERELESDENGNFSLQLPPGSYQLVIESPGFKVAKRNKVRVGAGVAEIEVVLKVQEIKYGKCQKGPCIWL